MKNLTVDINSLYSDLDLSPNEVADISVMFNSKAFRNVLSKIIQIKSLAIIDDIETQEQLEKARFTLEGNKEIYSIFEKGHTEFQDTRPDNPAEQNKQENSIIEEV